MWNVSGFLQMNWYDTPEYYDVIYDAGTSEEADFLEAIHRRYVRSAGKQLLEPACGTGRLVAELAGRGFSLSGFDSSRAMLDYARSRLRERGRRAELKDMDLADFSFGHKKFDMAYCLVSSFRHLSTEKEAKRHLRLVAQSLRLGGLYVIGLLLTDYSDRAATLESWVEERDGVQVHCNVKTWPANRNSRTAQMRARLTVTEAGKRKRFECKWQTRTYGPRQFRSFILAEPTLEIVGCHTFDYDMSVNVPLLNDDRLDKVVVLRRLP